MKKILAVALLLLSVVYGQSQDTKATQPVSAYWLTGQVKDQDKQKVVSYATVVVKGSNDKTITNENGIYKIKTTHPLPLTLLITSVGFETKEIVVTNDSSTLVAIKLVETKLDDVVVTARRRSEQVQDVPIPVAVLNRAQVENSGSFNVNRVKELVPSVQLYSSNPRNTGLNIRGLGSTFGLTNDGIDPGVGFYVDGVYYARPAATTIDFNDINQIEVLMGPQGTLFGKNTTSGAFNVTSRKPSFTTGANFELSYGNYGYTQSKISFTGPLVKDKLAARFSVIGTHRNGVLENVRTGKDENTLSNLGGKIQLLYTPNSKTSITLIGDNTSQRPSGYAQVFAGVVTTKKPAYQQFDSIIKDLKYNLPSRNPFDRIVDHNTEAQSNQDMGGVSLNIDRNLGRGKLTSTTAWRYWNWDPSSDRDFTGLDALRKSQAPSKHDQLSQEIRWAGDFNKRISAVFGIFAFKQHLRSDSIHTEEAGSDQWRFSQSSTSTLWQTPGLLDGYGIKTKQDFKNFSGAVFGQVDIKLGSKISILPGVRINHDEKTVYFRRKTYGGLQTTDAALIALKKKVYSDQEFDASIKNYNQSGNLTVNYKIARKYRVFATYALSFKPVGLNLGGLPTANGKPMLELATVKPEKVNHYELGFKSEPIKGGILNVSLYNTDISDYQTLVQAPDLSVNRGYLANAERVRVRGGELNLSYRFKNKLSVNGAVSYTEGTYVKFTNAPVPLEETGVATYKDISGGTLPGISKWSSTLGVEYSHQGGFFGQDGNYFIAADGFYRSGFSSSPSPSRYLNIDGYALLNARAGFRAAKGVTVFAWSRNLLGQNYFEQLLPGAGNVGHYAGVLGDPRTYGLTFRYNL